MASRSGSNSFLMASRIVSARSWATDRQALAHRAHALRSTGPRTPTGKDCARHHALTHGLASSGAVRSPDRDDAHVGAIGLVADESAPAAVRDEPNWTVGPEPPS